MPLHVISVDDQTSPGMFLNAFFQFGVDRTMSKRSVGRDCVRPVYSLLTADETTLKTLLNRHEGLLYCSMDAPIPLALRPSLRRSLSAIQAWMYEEKFRICVFDSHPIELAAQHCRAGYVTDCVPSRRIRLGSRAEADMPYICHSPEEVEAYREGRVMAGTGTMPGLSPNARQSPLQPIYEQLLRQFFCDADAIEIRPMGEPSPAGTAARAIQTTNDVNKLIVWRCLPVHESSSGDTNAARQPPRPPGTLEPHAVEHTVFAKFGAPYRLEREFANFNRLTAAVAHELRDRPADRVHMRRLFGYGHLSDAHRPIAESQSDFLGLFVASWHSHTSPPRGRDPRDGRLDRLLAQDCTDYEDPRLCHLVEDVCKTLAVLQGEWRFRSVGRSDYDCFFHRRRVLRLNFHDVRPHSPGRGVPKNHAYFRVCRAELLASRRQRPVDRLDCRVRQVAADEADSAVADPQELARIAPCDIRLVLKADATDAVSDVVSVVAEAFEKPIREGVVITFPGNWLNDPLRCKQNYDEQIKSLINSRVGAFVRVPKLFRLEVVDRYSRIYSEIYKAEARSGLVASRIHGDLYLVNILWSCEPDDDRYDFSMIDFEKMEFNAPAAWDYVVLELSLRFHWFLDRFKWEFQGWGEWDGDTEFSTIDKQLLSSEKGLASLSSADPLGGDLSSGYALLRKLVKTVRGAFLSRSRQVVRITDDEAKADYNRAMLMAVGSRAIGRHPDDYPTTEGALRLIWQSHIADLATEDKYLLAPDVPRRR